MRVIPMPCPAKSCILCAAFCKSNAWPSLHIVCLAAVSNTPLKHILQTKRTHALHEVNF